MRWRRKQATARSTMRRSGPPQAWLLRQMMDRRVTLPHPLAAGVVGVRLLNRSSPWALAVDGPVVAV